jgi:cytosine deaminase
MITTRPAALARLPAYGVEVGRAADLVVLDASEPEAAVAEIAAPLYGFKRGRRTFTRPAADLHRPN